MAAIEFHTGVADPVGYACRLLRKAYRQGARIAVTAPPALLDALDAALWTFDETDFVPHRRGADARTPLWLLDATVATPDAPAIVVNVGAPAPAEPDAFERVIEIVAADDEAAAAGRARWRGYKALGLEPALRNAPAG